MENNIALTEYEERPEFQELTSSSGIVLARAELLSILTQDDFSNADVVTRNIRSIRENIATFFGPLKAQAHKLHKDITTREKSVDAPYKDAEEIVRRKMEVYADEQKRIKEIEATRLRKEQEEAILRMATEAEVAGDTAVADALLAIPVTKINTSVPMPEKTSTRQDLVVEVTDIKALAAEVVAGRIGPGVFTVNESVIKAMVKSHGLEAANKLGGVKCSYKSTMIFRR